MIVGVSFEGASADLNGVATAGTGSEKLGRCGISTRLANCVGIVLSLVEYSQDRNFLLRISSVRIFKPLLTQLAR